MSYDLVVFEPGAAPADRNGFLAWYTEAAQLGLGDGRLACNSDATAPILQAWYRDMIKAFPALIGPDAPAVREMDDDRIAEYRFGPNAIFASFQWEASRKVQLQALRLARSHGVGLFDACGPTCAVWGPTDKGYYGVIHRSDAPSDE
jgi:hypothetical protein